MKALHADAARFVQQHRFDGGPFAITEFVALDSRLQFRSWNHKSRTYINSFYTAYRPSNVQLHRRFGNTTSVNTRLGGLPWSRRL